MIIASVAANESCSAGSEHAPVLQVVRIAGRQAIANSPLFIAEKEGFFAREGIRLAYVNVSGDLTHAIPALEQEKIDGLAAQLSVGFFNAIAKGARARIVADRGHIDPSACEFIGIVGRKSLFGAGEPTATQLRGLRVAMSPAGASSYLLARLLEAKRLKISDVGLVTIPDNVTPQALDDGSIDAAFASEPRLTPLLRRGHRLIAPASKYVPGLQYGVIVFGPSLLVRNRELGRRFISAYLKGVKQYDEGKTARNLDIISRSSGLDTGTLRSLCFPAIHEDGSMDSASLRRFQQWGVATGFQIRLLSAAQVTDDELLRTGLALSRGEKAGR